MAVSRLALCVAKACARPKAPTGAAVGKRPRGHEVSGLSTTLTTVAAQVPRLFTATWFPCITHPAHWQLGPHMQPPLSPWH